MGEGKVGMVLKCHRAVSWELGQARDRPVFPTMFWGVN